MKVQNEIFSQRRKEMALLTQRGLTILQIAAKYGITRQAVSQQLQKAARDGHKVILRKCGPIAKRNGHKNYSYLPTLKETGVEKSCEVCNKAFVSKSKAKKTCCIKCTKILIHKKLIEANGNLGIWSRYQNVVLSCNNCGKTFERTRYRDAVAKIGCGSKNSYCSRKCYLDKTKSSREGKIVQSYRGGSWPSSQEYQKKFESE